MEEQQSRDMTQEAVVSVIDEHAFGTLLTVVDGEPANRDVTVKYEQGGKVLAVATIFRDEESLKEELAMESRGAS